MTSPIELLIPHVYMEETKNIHEIMIKWAETFGTTVTLKSKDLDPNMEIRKELEFVLGTCYFDKSLGALVYVSEEYAEAIFIHELLHPLIHAEGYVRLVPDYSARLLKEIPGFGKDCKHISSELTNFMDHFVIYNEMMNYELDFDKLKSVFKIREGAEFFYPNGLSFRSSIS